MIRNGLKYKHEQSLKMRKVGKSLGFKIKHGVWNGHGDGYGLEMNHCSHGLYEIVFRTRIYGLRDESMIC